MPPNPSLEPTRPAEAAWRRRRGRCIFCSRPQGDAVAATGNAPLNQILMDPGGPRKAWPALAQPGQALDSSQLCCELCCEFLAILDRFRALDRHADAQDSA